MKHILTWLAVLALVAVALSAELPHSKNRGVVAGEDLKTASSFIGPYGIGYGYGWGYPYWGKGFGWGGLYGGYGGWGYPFWG